METILKHYGAPFKPSKFIELTFIDGDRQFTVEVTNSKGEVDPNLISNLRHIADELEEQNRLIKEKGVMNKYLSQEDLPQL